MNYLQLGLAFGIGFVTSLIANKYYARYRMKKMLKNLADGLSVLGSILEEKDDE